MMNDYHEVDDINLLDTNALPIFLLIMLVLSIIGVCIRPAWIIASVILFVLFLWAAARHGRVQKRNEMRKWKGH